MPSGSYCEKGHGDYSTPRVLTTAPTLKNLCGMIFSPIGYSLLFYLTHTVAHQIFIYEKHRFFSMLPHDRHTYFVRPE
jgi:hypothetical protein